MTKDPVCGMQVDEKKSPTSTMGGKKFAFCGQECKDKFDANPAQYASPGHSHTSKEPHHDDARKARV